MLGLGSTRHYGDNSRGRGRAFRMTWEGFTLHPPLLCCSFIHSKGFRSHQGLHISANSTLSWGCLPVIATGLLGSFISTSSRLCLAARSSLLPPQTVSVNGVNSPSQKPVHHSTLPLTGHIQLTPKLIDVISSVSPEPSHVFLPPLTCPYFRESIRIPPPHFSDHHL